MRKLLWLVCVCALVLSFGCTRKHPAPEPLDLMTKKPPRETEQQVAPQQKEQQVTEEMMQEEPPAPLPPSPMEVFQENYAKLPSTHTVVKGECLWWIAEYKQIYNDPFMWPLIYKDNRDQIKNPDLIYPGQVFSIPRQFSMNELKENRRSAGAPGPYLPPDTARLPYDLSKDLGWSE